MKNITIFVLLSLMAFVDQRAFSSSANGNQGTTVAQPQNVQRIPEETLSIGDVVVQGVPSGNGCSYPTVVVAITAPSIGQTRMLDLRNDRQCRLVVHVKWQGDALPTSTPSINSVPEVRADARTPDNNRAPEQKSITNDVWTNGAYVQYGQKSVDNHIWMYGYGGSWDDLTAKRGLMIFSFDGSTAFIDYQSGRCDAPSYWTGWRVIACMEDDVDNQGFRVSRRGHGDYYWEPLSTYYHTLGDYEEGYATGQAYCLYWWTGHIVLGVTATCTVR